MSKFEIYQDASGLGFWRWRLLAGNGKIIADSGEGYSSKTNCKRAVDRVKEIAVDAKYSIWNDD